MFVALLRPAFMSGSSFVLPQGFAPRQYWLRIKCFHVWLKYISFFLEHKLTISKRCRLYKGKRKGEGNGRTGKGRGRQGHMVFAVIVWRLDCGLERPP